ESNKKLKLDQDRIAESNRQFEQEEDEAVVFPANDSSIDVIREEKPIESPPELPMDMVQNGAIAVAINETDSVTLNVAEDEQMSSVIVIEQSMEQESISMTVEKMSDENMVVIVNSDQQQQPMNVDFANQQQSQQSEDQLMSEPMEQE
ncbi:hypothetical protein BLA29_003569, partial [Euroglyphus maynei]